VRDRGVPVLGVLQAPVAARDLRELGQDPVTEQPERWHLPTRGPIGESVPLRVVGVAFHDRIQERRELIRIHLSISVHRDRDIDVVVACANITGSQRAAGTLILRVANGDDFRPNDGAAVREGRAELLALVLERIVLGRPSLRTAAFERVAFGSISLPRGGRVRLNDSPGVVRRVVVDGVDAVDEVGHRREDVTDVIFLVVRRDDHADRVSSVHYKLR